MKEELFLLKEAEAIDQMAEIIHEIYQHNPKFISIILEAGINQVPTIHVEYDANVITKYIGEKVR